MRQRYYFATDNGMLIWDVDSMLKAIENHPGDFELRLVDTDVLARENQDAMVNETYAMETNLEKPCILERAIIFCWTAITVCERLSGKNFHV